MDKARRILKRNLEIPVHKIKCLLITQPELLTAACFNITNYGIAITKEIIEEFEFLLGAKLSGDEEIEYEWSEEEFDGLHTIKFQLSKHLSTETQ